MVACSFAVHQFGKTDFSRVRRPFQSLRTPVSSIAQENMNAHSTTEQQIEAQFIAKLQSLEYTYRPDIRNRDTLETYTRGLLPWDHRFDPFGRPRRLARIRPATKTVAPQSVRSPGLMHLGFRCAAAVTPPPACAWPTDVWATSSCSSCTSFAICPSVCPVHSGGNPSRTVACQRRAGRCRSAIHARGTSLLGQGHTRDRTTEGAIQWK